MKKLMFCVVLFLFMARSGHAATRCGEVTFLFAINGHKDASQARLWVPYPVTDRFQKIEDIEVSGNFDKNGVYREPGNGNLVLYAEWDRKTPRRTLTFRFKVFAKERSVPAMREEPGRIPVEEIKFLAAEPYMIPTSDKVKQVAYAITKNMHSIMEKAHAVYDWTVENTFRDPNVKGCGLGMADRMLVERGGKCADISSVFVALARAAGIPAREVFGLRLGKKNEQDITAGFHCWAEFYLPGTGWVPVDPADVRKMMLVHALDLRGAEKYRKYFFGRVDQYRIVLGKGGRNIRLAPPQEGGLLNYFMYPYGEIDGKPLDSLDPKNFSYQILFNEM